MVVIVSDSAGRELGLGVVPNTRPDLGSLRTLITIDLLSIRSRNATARYSSCQVEAVGLCRGSQTGLLSKRSVPSSTGSAPRLHRGVGETVTRALRASRFLSALSSARASVAFQFRVSNRSDPIPTMTCAEPRSSSSPLLIPNRSEALCSIPHRLALRAVGSRLPAPECISPSVANGARSAVERDGSVSGHFPARLSRQ